MFTINILLLVKYVQGVVCIFSGGITIDAVGEGFSNIQYPKMILYYQQKTFEGVRQFQKKIR